MLITLSTHSLVFAPMLIATAALFVVGLVIWLRRFALRIQIAFVCSILATWMWLVCYALLRFSRIRSILTSPTIPFGWLNPSVIP